MESALLEARIARVILAGPMLTEVSNVVCALLAFTSATKGNVWVRRSTHLLAYKVDL